MRRARDWWADRPLASQILVWTLVLIVLTVALGGFVADRITGQILDNQFQLRALGVAESVAQMPEVTADLASRDPGHQIQALAEQVRVRAKTDYVVVTDREGIRFSHPTPSLIGQRLEEPVAVLDGQSHLGTNHGSLGDSANAKAPILDAGGHVVGQVSVGILETAVSTEFTQDAGTVAAYSALILLLGGAGSFLLARTIKRATFGLEPAAIASLLQDREALLHGIREGMVGLDDDGRVTVINNEARRLLHLGDTALGQPVSELIPPGRLRDILTGDAPGEDQSVITEDALLVANRRPVSVGGRSVGAVVTLRDRTEVEALVRDLRSLEGLMDALRAQEHEYANRLHTVGGLLDLGEPEQARTFISGISDSSRSLGEGLRARIEPPELAALIHAKITIAAEQDVRLAVSEDSHLREPGLGTQDLLTIVGNLLDNAVDAVSGLPGPREVTLTLDDSSGVFVSVTDNGPGVPAEAVDDVVRDGYTTKPGRAGKPDLRRGIGLALVTRIVRRAGGTMDVFAGPGGRFEVWIPRGEGGEARP
ncbi:Sensor protein CitS [Sinomonas atrocyanea]|uniref:histidine kinase n=1 Tax=Sinomonas atrocyanea TaxID=37927 RepID=A0A127A5N5_9MICC|nr:sensor histidine kinase [Sinomonas atrocyanea]AMM34084.1 Sensor protein CitS [Sinomonas atrocyanea]GEB65117.1 histidine kinase [Sinomonas atrocyanea]GGG58898.1 histidine kinase [Sinomonas atrocyanea]